MFLKQLNLKEDSHQIIKRHTAEEQPLSRQKRVKRDSEEVLKAQEEEALRDLIAETPLDRKKRFKRDTHEGGILKKADITAKTKVRSEFICT